MTETLAQTAGVDISKETLDVCLYPAGAAQRFANDKKGHKALIAWLGPFSIQRVVYEATGAYHRSFERAPGSSGLAMAKINPWQARRFAEATGQRAKTDAVDAAMLARLGALLEPRAQTLHKRTFIVSASAPSQANVYRERKRSLTSERLS